MNLTYWTARQDKYVHSSDIPKEIEEESASEPPIGKDKQSGLV